MVDSSAATTLEPLAAPPVRGPQLADYDTGPDPDATPTVWGLEPRQLHDRFWAARGVQVIRRGQPDAIQAHAELFLLIDPHLLTIFRLGELVETLSWVKPRALFIRVHAPSVGGYRERIITDRADRFVRFERAYGDRDWRLGRVAITTGRDVAQFWQGLQDSRTSWRELRKHIPAAQRTPHSLDGSLYDGRDDWQVSHFVRELVQSWRRPDATIAGVESLGDRAWGDPACQAEGTRFVGSVWVGAGRDLKDQPSVVGPAVLWDSPDQRPEVADLDWGKIEASEAMHKPIRVRQLSSWSRRGKRLFDIVFALVGLAITVVLAPFIMLAIYIEDGRPFFFSHTRETRGGKNFKCHKFRTMWNNAEEIKKELVGKNQSDGPQFHMKDDPRVSRVGKFLRKTNLDELPQFWNVLVGEMSIVGPRPSPYKENQFCPPWREARLSVRPGITGLWQVKRSRLEGIDFQEWIRYDTYYVENMSWKHDLSIIFQTLRKIVMMG